MKKLLLLTTCLLSGLAAAGAPGGPSGIEQEPTRAKYFQYTHPVTNEIQPHTGLPMVEGSARNVSKKLYEGAAALENIIPADLLELVDPRSTDAYVVSSILGDGVDKEFETLSNRMTVLLEVIRKAHGTEISALAKAMRALAKQSSGIYLGKTTDGKSRK